MTWGTGPTMPIMSGLRKWLPRTLGGPTIFFMMGVAENPVLR